MGWGLGQERRRGSSREAELGWSQAVDVRDKPTAAAGGGDRTA